MENAGKAEEERIRGLVRDIPGRPENRDEIVSFVKANGGLEYAEAMLDKYVNEAVGALAVLPDSYEKKCLEELAFYTADRKK